MFPLSKELIYYKDKKCTQKLPFEGVTQKIIGDRIVRRGEDGSATVYMRNESPHDYEIRNIISQPNVYVNVSKDVVAVDDVVEINISWTVPADLEKPFEADFILEGDFIIK